MLRRLFVPLALFLIAAGAVAADAPLTLARYGISSTTGAPVVASNGTDFVLAWKTRNTIRTLSNRLPSALPVPIVSDASIESGASPFADFRPSLAWNGTRFAMAYASGEGNAVNVAMLDGDGRLLHAPITLPSPAYLRHGAQIAWNGKRFLVVWGVNDLTHAMYGQLLDSDGAPIGDRVTLSKIESTSFRVAANGSRFLIANASDFNVTAIAVDENANVMASNKIGSCFPATVAIAGNGKDFAISWPGVQTLYARLVHDDATIASDTKFVATIPEAGILFPFMAWNGSSFSIAFTASRAIYMTHIASDATPFDDAKRVVISDSTPSLSSNGSADAITFSDALVHAYVVRNDGTLAPMRAANGDGVVNFGAADQDRVVVAKGADETIVVWRESDGNSRTLRSGRLSASGWIEGAAFANGVDITNGPAIASSGDVHLIAWVDSAGHLRSFRLDRNLTPLDASAPDYGTLGTFTGSLTAAWDGRNFAVVNAVDGVLRLTRIGRAGELIAFATMLRPSINSDSANAPSAASNGMTTVIAYVRAVGCNFCISDLRIETLTLDDPRPRVIIDDNSASTPAMAWNGDHFLAAWTSYNWIRTISLDPNGAPASAPQRLYPVTWPESLRDAALTWNGRSFETTFCHTHNFLFDATVVTNDLADGQVVQRGPIESGDRPVAAGPLLFYATRINDAPYFGAKRIVVTDGTATTLDVPHVANVTSSGVTWTSGDARAIGFRIEARETGGVYREIAETSGNARAAAINVAAGTMIRVRAWSAAGVSAYSNEVMFAPAKRRAAR